jgi:hypothetical protein
MYGLASGMMGIAQNLILFCKGRDGLRLLDHQVSCLFLRGKDLLKELCRGEDNTKLIFCMRVSVLLSCNMCQVCVQDMGSSVWHYKL